MRRILVEWLIELYEELRLSAEVLLSAVHHVDRFLSSEVRRGLRPGGGVWGGIKEGCAMCVVVILTAGHHVDRFLSP